MTTPDRPRDRDQQQAGEVADDDMETAAVIMSDVVISDRPNRVGYAIDCIAAALAAARAEEAARWQAKIEAIVADMTHAIDSGYYGGSEYEDATARLRALLDGEQR